ncbi:MAG: SUMF1/EgtB/PvdO family nonheme iron enzyme [Myxococcales bacterium]|nr:SUMF1/EgtB/PvdO family nonheme iron enzyme [Myxococcales bacterium]
MTTDAATADAATPDAEAADATPDMAADAAPDAHVDAAPDASVDATPDACAPQPEQCNGLDDDCDGDTDEEIEAECAACGVPGALGACGVGVRLCVGGEWACVPPAPPADADCNLTDDDCDGDVDEAGERADAPPAHPAVADRARCAIEPPDDDGRCADGAVGCRGGAHACACCRAACAGTRADCAGCVDAADCLTCQQTADVAYRECLADCAPDPAPTAWTCAPRADDVPACAPVACPYGSVPEGEGCRRVEICNNGLDDDDDGLVDGTIVGPDPCMASIDVSDAPQPFGFCRAHQDCDGFGPPLVEASPPPAASTAEGDAEPLRVNLDYAFAVDREEVSMRAYHACVLDGCCLPPTGRAYRQARDAGAFAQPRPVEPDGCAPARAAGAPFDADAPATGLTWCQARDYCAWAGKRLATSAEWELTARGGGAQRAYPWGNEEPNVCLDSQCCRPEGNDDPIPGLCVGVDALPICPDAETVRPRPACLATVRPDDDCTDQPVGPAPVYANVDGQGPDGVLNMAGNVGEWVFDWNPENYAGLNPNDPVGPACDRSGLDSLRTVRGPVYEAGNWRSTTAGWTWYFDSLAGSDVGFRCARTVPEGGGACAPDMPDVPVACAPSLDDAEPCRVGPDFRATTADERAACGGAQDRATSGQCVNGLVEACATDQPLDCDDLLISEAALQLESQATILLNAVFAATLAPAGGNALMVLALPEGFDVNSDGDWNIEIGTGRLGNGRLRWAGLGDDPCVPMDRMVVRARTRVANRGEIPLVCSLADSGQVALDGAPVNTHFSGVTFRARVDGDTMTGTLTLVMSGRDAEASTVGRPGGLATLLESASQPPLDLCPLLGACSAAQLTAFGCVDGRCTGDDCDGYVLPLAFTAVPARSADVAGLNCQPPP